MSMANGNGNSLTPRWMLGILLAMLGGAMGVGGDALLRRSADSGIDRIALENRITKCEENMTGLRQSIADLRTEVHDQLRESRQALVDAVNEVRGLSRQVERHHENGDR